MLRIVSSGQQVYHHHRGGGMQRPGAGHSGSSGRLASIPVEEDDEGYEYEQPDFSTG